LFSCSTSSDSENDNQLGLRAVYSNGQNVIETVILHGWGSQCSETANNLYQGVCTPVDQSPLDWAWGNNYTVIWSGFINIPQAGDYVFSAWVDGTVFIAINDSVVADFNTVGSAYSKTLNFTQADWYPVSMTFTANGGSNYMHLGWVRPGEAYQTVTAEYLKYE